MHQRNPGTIKTPRRQARRRRSEAVPVNPLQCLFWQHVLEWPMFYVHFPVFITYDQTWSLLDTSGAYINMNVSYLKTGPV